MKRKYSNAYFRMSQNEPVDILLHSETGLLISSKKMPSINRNIKYTLSFDDIQVE